MIKKYFKNELFIASMILMILMNLANIINYFFHFIMARMLGPSDYAVLAVLTSIIYIFSVPTSSIQTLISKKTTSLLVKREFGKIKGIFKSGMKEGFFISLVFFILFLAVSFFLSPSLKISFWLLAITGVFIFTSFILPVGTGILQGMKKFSSWGWNTILNSTAKIILAVLLVFIGFGVYGPMLGFVFGAFISLIFIFPSIKEITSSKEKNEKIHILSMKNFSTVFSILIITLMYSLDIIFAKAFFSSEIAGIYSVASMIGKMIFFGTSTIMGAMFPISSEKFSREGRKEARKIMKKSFILICSLCFIAIALLYLFPERIISLLFGKSYIESTGIVLYLAIAYSFISLINSLILYKISIEEFKIRHSLILGGLLVIQLAFFIVAKDSIKFFSFAFMSSTIISFLICLILMKKWRKSEENQKKKQK